MSDARTITFGCRLNSFESEVMEAHARAAGLAETVIVNTCAVTAEAVRQAAQAIRKVRREQPGTRIVVTGCAAQTDSARFAAMPEVDHVLGNGEKMRAESWRSLAGAGSGERGEGSDRVQVGDIMALASTAPHLVAGMGDRARAHVEVQNGCDHRCTFCIIPYGRGASRSVPIAHVVDQVRALVESGHGEVVLTGVDLTAWGLDLGEAQRLGDLVRAVLAHVPELRRLRLSSIDQIEADAALLEAIAEEERLMPHLHLSLQAGDDMVLKRMKRRHSRASAVAFSEEVRRLRPDIVLGADLIAGFPTESEAMFESSERLIEDCGLTYLHVFPFSARPGTPAARMPQVPREIARERAARLRAKGETALGSFLEAQRGATVELLMERDGVGRTRQFAEARVSTHAAPGSFVRARITGVAGRQLVGEAVA
jgi:threonylcarbamoyladenosine tRNA methylthiotransferase MtaB